MCRSMADIQSPTAEIRRGKKKKEEEDRKKLQDENIIVCPITQGDHNKAKQALFAALYYKLLIFKALRHGTC